MIYLDKPIVNYKNKIVWAGSGRASDFLPLSLSPPVYLLNGLKFKDIGQPKADRAQAMNTPNSQLAEGVFFFTAFRDQSMKCFALPFVTAHANMPVKRHWIYSSDEYIFRTC